MALHRPLCPDGRGAGDLDAVAHCPEGSRPFVLAATILASAMGFIDGTVVTIALPSIQKDFGADFTTLQWVVNGYALMLGSLILVGGGAGDKFGRRRVFLIGIGLFVLASLCCALAPGLAALIFARICQGIGAALMIPQSLAIIAASFPKDVRGRAIGIWAGASAITTALGPPLGGFLIDILSWRAAFWINVPIAAAVVWLTLRHVPESRSEDAEGGLDWTGGALAVIGFGALTLSLTTASQTAAFSASALMWLALGVVGIVAFLVTEHRVTQPLMPPSLFKSKSFTGSNLTTLFLYGAFTAMLFLLPFDLIGLRGYSSAEVGLILLPIGLVIGVASRSAGHWADHTGPRLPLILGSLTVAVAAGVFALNLQNFWIGVFLPILVVSAGMAVVVAPLTTAVMNAAPNALSGAASGINNAASRIAGLFAVAIVGSAATIVFLSDLTSAGIANDGAKPRFGSFPDVSSAARPAIEAAFLHAYSAAMLIAAAFGALAALTAYLTVQNVPAKPTKHRLKDF